jgi:hypothetical protein
LHNGNAGSQPSLSEADIAEAEGFLDEMRLCFPLVGADLFETPPSIKATETGTLLSIKAKGLSANGHEAGSDFVVKKGSQASLTEVKSIDTGSTQRRKAFRENGVLVERAGHLVFTQDYSFTSPSQAAAVILGRTANGRIEWTDAKGRSLKSIQEAAG